MLSNQYKINDGEGGTIFGCFMYGPGAIRIEIGCPDQDMKAMYEQSFDEDGPCDEIESDAGDAELYDVAMHIRRLIKEDGMDMDDALEDPEVARAIITAASALLGIDTVEGEISVWSNKKGWTKSGTASTAGWKRVLN